MEGSSSVVVVVTLCNSCPEMALRHDMLERMRAAEDAAAAATAGGDSVILGGMTPAFFAIFSVVFFYFLRWIN
jgi:hypothetical protein